MHGGTVAVPNARLTIPSVRGLVRPRLLAMLDGVPRARLGLVAAPPGYGKTTLMAQWAATFPGQVAWYRAEPADRSIQDLGRCLSAAVAVAVRRGAARTRPLPGPKLLDAVEELALALERQSAPLLLVVDDLDALEGSLTVRAVERFLLLAPPQVCLLIGARRQPALNLVRSELPEPVRIGRGELRFRSYEVEELSRDRDAPPVYPTDGGGPLPLDDARALTRASDGWPAALRLLLDAGPQPAPDDPEITSNPALPASLRTYLTTEVLDELPRDLRRFLVHTCVFDVLSGERCDALLQASGSHRSLHEFQRRQTLVQASNDNASFRYPGVLRRHLRAEHTAELGCLPPRATTSAPPTS